MNTQNKELITRYYYSPGTKAQRGNLSAGKVSPHMTRVFTVTMLLVFGVVICAKLLFANNTNSSATANSNKSNTPAIPSSAATAAPAKPTTSAKEMTTIINQIIATNADVDISISVLDLKTNNLSHFGVPNTVVFEAASVAKLITACDYLHHTETGDYSLGQDVNDSSAQDNLQQMIVNSDNTAWENLNDILTHADLSNYATTIGIANYDPDTNTLTSDDIARLEQKLYQGKLLNKSDTHLLLSYMAQANRADLIKSAVPPGVTFYHKAGWLEDRVHDAAIIDDGKHPYILVIFTNGQDNTHANDRSTIIHDITKATVAHFISSE